MSNKIRELLDLPDTDESKFDKLREAMRNPEARDMLEDLIDEEELEMEKLVLDPDLLWTHLELTEQGSEDEIIGFARGMRDCLETNSDPLSVTAIFTWLSSRQFISGALAGGLAALAFLMYADNQNNSVRYTNSTTLSVGEDSTHRLTAYNSVSQVSAREKAKSIGVYISEGTCANKPANTNDVEKPTSVPRSTETKRVSTTLLEAMSAHASLHSHDKQVLPESADASESTYSNVFAAIANDKFLNSQSVDSESEVLREIPLLDMFRRKQSISNLELRQHAVDFSFPRTDINRGSDSEIEAKLLLIGLLSSLASPESSYNREVIEDSASIRFALNMKDHSSEETGADTLDVAKILLAVDNAQEEPSPSREKSECTRNTIVSWGDINRVASSSQPTSEELSLIKHMLLRELENEKLSLGERSRLNQILVIVEESNLAASTIYEAVCLFMGD